MKQQRLFGFFHQFTPEGRSESTQTSANRSPKRRPVQHDSTSLDKTSPTQGRSHNSVNAAEKDVLLDVPYSNPRSRQVSEASSIGSKRSREDDVNDHTNGSPTPKAPRIAPDLARSNTEDEIAASLKISNDEQDVPSSSLTVLSHTPSATSQRLRSFVQSSQDSESDEIELVSTSGPSLQINRVERHDTDGDASDSSLGDLQGFTPKHKQRARPSSHSPESPALAPQSTQTPSGRRTTRTGVGAVRRQDYYEPHYFDPSLFDEPERSEPVAKFSLARLVKQHHKETAQELEIARHLQILEAAQQEQDATTKTKDTPPKDAILASLVNSNDNDGNAERLKMALGRIEAMKTSTRWYFFDIGSKSAARDDSAEFPARKLAGDPVWCHLCDPTLRAHAFLTGFALDCLRRNKCPDELRQWLWASALEEKRDDLAYTCMAAFQMCSRSGITFLQFQEALRKMGASESAVSTSGAVKPLRSNNSVGPIMDLRRSSMWRLPFLLDSTRAMSPRLDNKTRTAILILLLKMGLDADAMTDAGVKGSLQSCMQAIVDSFDGDQATEYLNESLMAIFGCVENLILRADLVAAIPDGSPRSHLFKQRLALAFYLDDIKLLKMADLHTLDLNAAVAERLNRIDVLEESVDFARVAAQVLLLDVSIGAGFAQENSADDTSEEKFDIGIDQVSRSVKQLFARIIDTGTSHMARTEAKGTLECLQYRLDYAVRTKPPPKANIYEDVMVGRGLLQDKKSAAFLSNFLRSTKVATKTEDGANSSCTAAAAVESAT